MKPVLWIPFPIPTESVELARTLFDVIYTSSDERASEWFMLADAAVVRTGGISDQHARASKRLKIICRNGAGYDTIPLVACADRGIVCTNLPGYNAATVAELALGLALSLLRRISEVNRRIFNGESIPSVQCMGSSLEGRVLGLSLTTYGKGASNCTVIVYSPTSPPNKWPDLPHRRCATLDELLREADVVSLHCPLNDQTKNMISSRQFDTMKPSAILMNTARGGLIEYDALVEALRTGKIAGAAIDAHETEPPTRELYGELIDLPNALITPHIGAGTREMQHDSCRAAIMTAYEYLNTGSIGNYGSRIVSSSLDQ